MSRSRYCPDCSRPIGYCHPNCPSATGDEDEVIDDRDDREEYEKDQLLGED